VKVEVLNSTGVKIEWRPPSGRELNGIIRGYRVYYVPLGHLDEPLVNVPPTKLDLADGLRTEVVVGGLQPDTVYQFEVEAYTRKGHGERSRPRKVRTKGAGSLSLTLLFLSSNITHSHGSARVLYHHHWKSVDSDDDDPVPPL